MKRVCAAFALTALATAAISLAQSPPQSQPPASTPQPEEQQPTNPPTQPSDSSSEGSMGQATQALMRQCVQRMQSANPNALQKDIHDYCEKQVKSQSQGQTPRD